MKKTLLKSLLLIMSLSPASSYAQWAWIKGNNALNAPAVFGTVGVPAAANNPNSTYAPFFWDDGNGTFWLYSGSTSDNTLWKYSALTNQWVVVKASNGGVANLGTMGVPSPQNNPGTQDLQGCSWVGKNNDLWLYAGATGFQGLLWRFNITTNEWTWMHGSLSTFARNYGTLNVPAASNTPHTRSEKSATWTDNNGNLWLINEDVWMFDIGLNMWVWKGGINTPWPFMQSGTLGLASPSNNPGRRYIYNCWTDANNNAYFFGGQYSTQTTSGNVTTQNNYNMVDMWKYNPNTNQFTWISGNNNTNVTDGVYGTKCTPSVNNYPKPRIEDRQYTKDKCGNFWLFGGTSDNTTGLNDLWKYKPSTNEWTWVSGSNAIVPISAAVWGTQGLAAPGNIPAGRGGGFAAFYKGIYIGFGQNSYSDNLNDLWKYAPKPIVDFSSTPAANCSIQFNDKSLPECGGDLQSWKWNFGDGTTSTLQNPLHQYANSGTYNVTLVVTNCLDVQDSIMHTVVSQGSISFTNTISPSSCTSSTGSASINVTTPGNYNFSWNPNVSSTNSATNLSAGTYVVTISDAGGCSKKDTIVVKSNSDLKVVLQNNVPALCGMLGSASITATGTATPFTYNWLPTGGNTNAATLPAGSYTVMVADANGCKDSVLIKILNAGLNIISQYTSTNVTCNGKKTGSIVVNPGNGAPPYTYSWQPNVGTTNSPNNLVAGNYIATITDANGCTGTKSITISEPTAIVSSINAAPKSICLGENSTLNVTATGGTGAFNFIWKPGSQVGASINVSPASNATYTCYVTDVNNCIDSINTAITIKPGPIAIFSGGGKACGDTTIQFTDNSTISGGSISTWFWDFGDGSTSVMQNPQHIYNHPGTFNVTLTVNALGCINKTTIAAAIIIYPKPIANFNFVSNGQGEVEFHDQSNGAQQWYWNFGDNSTDYNQNPLHIYNIEQTNLIMTTTLIVTANAGNCKDSLKKEINVQDSMSFS